MNDEQIRKMATDFYITSIRFFGKLIALPSNQLFCIEQIKNKEKSAIGEYYYQIQYGFPQSGSVILNFSYFRNNNKVNLTRISISAPPADKEMVVANAAPQASGMSEDSVSLSFGIDNGTVEHNTIRAIAANPNAIEMLKIALSDLSKAQILGECMIMAPEESETIPCCISQDMPRTPNARQ